MIITAELLKSKGCCSSRANKFKNLWPQGGSVTLARCRKAVRAGLSLDWAAENLFAAHAREAYEKATVHALEDYEKDTAPAREAYEKAMAHAREAYEKAKAPAFQAYEKAKAHAFFEASKLVH